MRLYIFNLSSLFAHILYPNDVNISLEKFWGPDLLRIFQTEVFPTQIQIPKKIRSRNQHHGKKRMGVYQQKDNEPIKYEIPILFTK